MDSKNIHPMGVAEKAVIDYAALHPFTQFGDYARAGAVIGLVEDTVRRYAKRNGLNTAMPRYKAGAAGSVVTIPEQDHAGTFAVRVRTYLTGSRATEGELADYFDCAPKTIRAALGELKAQACALDCEDGRYGILNTIRPVIEPVRETMQELGARGGHFVIGHTADWHVGSKYCRQDVITKLYEWYKAEGVSKVYLAGNWIDGEAQFNQFDLDTHGMTAQVQKFIQVCPQIPGIDTEVLSGDDHEGFYVQREGVNIGQLLELEAHQAGRQDITDIGYMERDIELAPGQAMRIIHAGGGSAYAISYKAQKYAESLQGGEKPRIVVMGHYHKYDFCYPREIYVLQPGCCQDQTPFMRKRQIQAHVGGCIMDIHINDDGILDDVGCRFKSFFDRAFYEHKW
jgi:hypothetical protein